jgi:hypothetical protein
MQKGKAQADNDYREEDFFHCILSAMVQGSRFRVQRFSVRNSEHLTVFEKEALCHF